MFGFAVRANIRPSYHHHLIKPPAPATSTLLQWDETRTVCGTNTWSTVLDRLVTDTELSQIMTNHFRLDFDLVEFLARVDTDDATDHFWHDNHISKVSFDQVWFFVGLGALFRTTEFLDELERTALETAVEPTASTGVEERSEV